MSSSRRSGEKTDMPTENENDVTDVVTTEGYQAASLSDTNNSHMMRLYKQRRDPYGSTDCNPSNSLKAIIERVFNAMHQEEEEEEDEWLLQKDVTEMNRNNREELIDQMYKNVVNQAAGLNEGYEEIMDELKRTHINYLMKNGYLKDKIRVEKENALRCLKNIIKANTAADRMGATNYPDVSSRNLADCIGSVVSNTYVHPLHYHYHALGIGVHGINPLYIPTNSDANNNAYMAVNMLQTQAPVFSGQQEQNQLALMPARQARNTPTNNVQAHRSWLLNARHRVAPYETPYTNGVHRHNMMPELNDHLRASLNAQRHYHHPYGLFF